MLVNVHVGVTFHIGSVNSNQYGRVDLEYRDLDPALDIDTQLAAGKAVAGKAFAQLVSEVNKQVQEVYSGNRNTGVAGR